MIGKLIKSARRSLDMTQDELAEKIGVTRGAVSSWETGAYEPSNHTTKLIAEALNVSVAYLLGGNEQLKMDSKPAYMPFYGRIHAGDPTEPSNVDESINVPFEVLEAHKNGFVLKVWGNCMDKVYPDGCHVVIDPDIVPQSGDIGAFIIDGGDIVMRRIYRGANRLMLSPESFDVTIGDIIPGNEQEIKSLGKIVWFQASEEL